MKTIKLQKALRIIIAFLIPVIIVLTQNLAFGKINNPYTPEKYDFLASYIVLGLFYILFFGLTKSIFKSTLIKLSYISCLNNWFKQHLLQKNI